jgi:hypothetical protein
MNKRLQEENQSALAEVEHGRHEGNKPGTWGGELGQPVRNT